MKSEEWTPSTICHSLSKFSWTGSGIRAVSCYWLWLFGVSAGCQPTCQHRRRRSHSRFRALWHLRVVPPRSKLKLVVRRKLLKRSSSECSVGILWRHALTQVLQFLRWAGFVMARFFLPLLFPAFRSHSAMAVLFWRSPPWPPHTADAFLSEQPTELDKPQALLNYKSQVGEVTWEPRKCLSQFYEKKKKKKSKVLTYRLFLPSSVLIKYIYCDWPAHDQAPPIIPYQFCYLKSEFDWRQSSVFFSFFRRIMYFLNIVWENYIFYI